MVIYETLNLIEYHEKIDNTWNHLIFNPKDKIGQVVGFDFVKVWNWKRSLLFLNRRLPASAVHAKLNLVCLTTQHTCTIVYICATKLLAIYSGSDWEG